MLSWKPSIWREYPIKQAPNYEDRQVLQAVEQELSSYPPLVFAKEVDLLKQKLKKVGNGEAFILQGGDCAESFVRFSGSAIRDFYKLMLQMSVVLGYSSGVEIVKIGRIAGQFAKPRSEEFEEREGIKLPSFRGDIINDVCFTQEARKHNPKRMLRAYQQSASTLNLLRAFSKGGMADLHLLAQYNLAFVKNHSLGKRYIALAQEISQAIDFFQSCGVSLEQIPNFCEFFVSHEALLLHYEEALCRQDSLSGKFYDCSSHFLWIGERTFDSVAHLQFISGIENPKGLKIGTKTSSNQLLRVLDCLNPNNQQGEIVLIVRMGKDEIKTFLPPLLETIKKEGREVVWINDPMHGNTIKSNGVKTRYFSSVMEEIKQFFSLCNAYGIRAGGLHLEMTEENVTECIGGAITQEKLSENYLSQCDPRLNATQALELAFLVAEMMKKQQ